MPDITLEKMKEMIGPVVEAAVKTHLDSVNWVKESNDDEAKEIREVDAFRAQKKAEAEASRDKLEIAGGVIRALAAARFMDVPGNTFAKKAEYIAEKVFGDEQVKKQLQFGTDSAGGYLIDEQRFPGVVELLRAQSVVRQMNPIIFPMIEGKARMPKLAGGSSASYVGESTNIPPSEPSFGQVNLTEKKLAALVPASNDLLRVPSASANQVIMEDIQASLGLRSDLAFIRGDGSANDPVGLENLGGSTFAANGTVNLANVTSDLGTAILNLQNANVRMIRPGWLMAPRTAMYLMTVRDGNGNFAFRDEMLAGRLWGFPYKTTTQIPINLGAGTDESIVYLADFADIIIAEVSSIEIMASDVAAYYDGSAVQAAFSRDETVIRAIERHDFGTRHAESICTITSVLWTP